MFSVPLSDPAGCRLYVWWSRESTDALRFELTAGLANFTTSGIPAHLAQGAKVLYDPGDGETAEVPLEQFIEGVRQVVMGAGLPVEVV